MLHLVSPATAAMWAIYTKQEPPPPRESKFGPDRSIFLASNQKQAAMLREGIARARAILQERKPDTAGRGGRGKRRREESEAKRLSGLDLGEGSRFAALAEKCLDLEEGVSAGVGNGGMKKNLDLQGRLNVLIIGHGYE